MATVKCPVSFAKLPINITDVFTIAVFTEHCNSGLHCKFVERSRLSMKFLNHILMILRQQRRNNIPLGRKLKYIKKPRSVIKKIRSSCVDVRKSSAVARFQCEIFKG